MIGEKFPSVALRLNVVLEKNAVARHIRPFV